MSAAPPGSDRPGTATGSHEPASPSPDHPGTATGSHAPASPSPDHPGTALDPIVVCRRWVDLRPSVDPLTGAVESDPRTSGASAADDAALEWALQAAEAWGTSVVAVTVGPTGSQAVLRDALAAGAARAIQVDLGSSGDAASVAAEIAAVARALSARMVLCGDMGVDRGSGAVPALVAAAMGARQALGLVDLTIDPAEPGVVTGWRRLDGGRRQHLRAQAPFVASVEGASIRLRRASLAGVLRSGGAPIEVVAATGPTGGRVPSWMPASTGPGRPRTHVVDGPDPHEPAWRRVTLLTGSGADRPALRVVHAEPVDAAHQLIAALADWGEWE
ncbi:MAG: mycofactocin-associated electron transfer flavoprotein beta subunit [Actinomycetota bacterium]|nr:mycofactocin-associated electron transfer flavoprotein beta subunit [Actinomycetota bacterium]MDA8281375.1 mycofactocin-associated electron transfer flavoprotein beta subunit [Actinomycetota bacterium]